MTKITLIAGGARSGKSAFALSRLLESKGEKYYLATSPMVDSEMNERILNHKKEREGLNIKTIEEEIKIGKIFKDLSSRSVLILDCLTLWINNLLFHNPDLSEFQVEEETRKSFDKSQLSLDEIIVVTNEVGMGIVPIDSETRRYRDLLGRANQVIGEICDAAYFISCGLPLKLKENEPLGEKKWNIQASNL